MSDCTGRYVKRGRAFLVAITSGVPVAGASVTITTNGGKTHEAVLGSSVGALWSARVTKRGPRGRRNARRNEGRTVPTPAGEHVVRTFENLTDFARYAEAHGNLNASSHGPDDDSKDTPTMAAAVDLAFHGWTLAADKARANSERLADQVREIVVREADSVMSAVAWDVDGSAVDVARFMEHEPECMMQWPVQPGRPRIVRIGVSCGASVGIGAAHLERRAVGIATIVDALEALDCRVEVIVDSTITRGIGHGRMHTVSCMVKATDQPLDLPRLVFAMGHPSMLRRLVFAAREAESEWHTFHTGNYGYSMPRPDRDTFALYFAPVRTDNARACPFADPETDVTDAARKLVHRIMEASS